jgi:hypothetical protein
MFIYQVYNTLVALFMAEFYGWCTLAHHLTTGMVAYLALMPYMQYSTVFFFGVTELTNIPLTICDVCKFFPEYKKAFPTIYTGSRLLFSLLFIGIRLVIWPIMSFGVCRRCFQQLMDGDALAPTGILFSTLLLTAMQIAWGVRIIRWPGEILGCAKRTRTIRAAQ